MSAGDFRLLFTIIALVFLFYGEPDVWDNLHAWVMEATAKPVTTQ